MKYLLTKNIKFLDACVCNFVYYSAKAKLCVHYVYTLATKLNSTRSTLAP